MQADWLSVSEARERILSGVPSLPPERRPLQSALGRVLAEEITSPLDLPLWDNSAMDGFAVHSADVHGATRESPRSLRVVDDVPAGGFPTRPIARGEAARVMTGAPVPEGADAVIRVEHTDGGVPAGTPDAAVEIRSDDDAGRNIRPRGEELRTGDRVIPRGRVLRAAEIGMAATLGRSHLSVIRRPCVAVLTSGDELVDVDGFTEVLGGRRIVSSNSYMLMAQLAEAGVEARMLGIAADTRESLLAHLEAARGCDALVTSAGISMGEHDLMRDVLLELGARIDFWRVRMRPGSPFAFGRIDGLGGIPWFGLPGNPVSSAVTFELFVRPALLRMAGHTSVFAPTVRARLCDRYPARPGLAHFPRVRLESGSGGLPRAFLAGPQGSGILRSMVEADALAVVPEEQGEVAPGQEITAMLLGGAPLHAEPGY